MAPDHRHRNELAADAEAVHAQALRGLQPAIAELDDLRTGRIGRPAILPRAAIADFLESRRRLVCAQHVAALAQRGSLTGTLAARLLGALAPPVLADPRGGLKAPVLLTASALEEIAVAAHQAALASPATAVVPAIRELARSSIARHDRHRMALEAMLRAAGGRPGDLLRPSYVPAIAGAPPRPRSAGDLVAEAALVERIVADAYESDAAALPGRECPRLLGTIAAVHRRHGAALEAASSTTAELVGRRAPPEEAGAGSAALPPVALAPAV